MILALDTSGKLTAIALLKEGKKVAGRQWEAGRELSVQLLPEIAKLLAKLQLGWEAIRGVVIFAGPGSFTGLRIGFTTANTIAYSLNVPVVSAQGEDWTKDALAALAQAKAGEYVFPQYGSPAKITLPKAK